MSAQSGTFYPDRRPVAADVATAMGNAIAPWGTDGGAEHVGPGIVMAARVLAIAPEDANGSQPVVLSSGLVVTWDGRLDNRDDLLLQLATLVDRDASDAQLAAIAFQQWREAAFRQLQGDWSVAVYDAGKHEVWLASDYMGIRPLFYSTLADRLDWCTSLRVLAERTDGISHIDERYVVSFLTFTPVSDVTPYRGISSLRAGHYLHAHGHDVEYKAYWSLPTSTIRYGQPADYEAHLRWLFREAVRSRLRSTTPVWVHLSGGLDSSSVACMAHTLIQQGVAAAPAIRTVSYVSDGSPESDERRFIHAVEQYLGAPGEHFRLEDHLKRDDIETSWVSPYERDGLYTATLRAIRQSASRCLMTGNLGDAVMGNYIDHSCSVAALLSAGRILEGVRSTRQWARATQKTVWQILAQVIGMVLLPSSGGARRQLIRALNEQKGLPADRRPTPTAAFLLHSDLAALWFDMAEESGRREREMTHYGKWHLAQSILHSAGRRHFESPSELPGVVTTHPFGHRPLVEFAFAIPPEVFCPPGKPRDLMRRAFAGFVPPRILARFSKGYAAPALERAGRTLVTEFVASTPRLDDLHVVTRRYVDPEALRERVAAVQSGTAMPTLSLSMIIGLELWLRNHHMRESGAR